MNYTFLVRLYLLLLWWLHVCDYNDLLWWWFLCSVALKCTVVMITVQWGCIHCGDYCVLRLYFIVVITVQNDCNHYSCDGYCVMWIRYYCDDYYAVRLWYYGDEYYAARLWYLLWWWLLYVERNFEPLSFYSMRM